MFVIYIWGGFQNNTLKDILPLKNILRLIADSKLDVLMVSTWLSNAIYRPIIWCANIIRTLWRSRYQDYLKSITIDFFQNLTNITISFSQKVYQRKFISKHKSDLIWPSMVIIFYFIWYLHLMLFIVIQKKIQNLF